MITLTIWIIILLICILCIFFGMYLKETQYELKRIREIRDWYDRNSQIAQEQHLLETKNQTLTTENNNLKKQNNTLQEKITNYHTETKNLNKAINKKNKEIKRLENENKELQLKIKPPKKSNIITELLNEMEGELTKK